MTAQTTSQKDTTDSWIPGENVLDGNKLKITASRAFKHDDEARTWKLGTNKKWAIGFFDMAGPAAFSPVMTLQLESGMLEAVQKAKMKKIAEAKAAKEAEAKRIADAIAR